MKPVEAGNYDGVPFPVVAFLAKADIVSNVDQILLETPQCIGLPFTTAIYSIFDREPLKSAKI